MAQPLTGINDDDLNVGGDIFTDFTEDLEDTQILEDERFFKYGRFFAFHIYVGTTQFGGNRGTIYQDEPPTFGMAIHYFSDFQSSWGIGFAFSKHSYFINESTVGFDDGGPGFVEVSMFRSYFSYRYYLDTSNLGTAITYSNPYIAGRMEYWYTSQKYQDREDQPDDKGGGIGIGIGGGLEFPIKLKESYVNLEFLIHDVAFHDKETRKLVPKNSSGVGVEDLSGYAYTTTLAYVWSW